MHPHPFGWPLAFILINIPRDRARIRGIFSKFALGKSLKSHGEGGVAPRPCQFKRSATLRHLCTTTFPIQATCERQTKFWPCASQKVPLAMVST